MNTYSTLKVSIASWLAQSNITSSDSIVDDFIDMAEAEVNRRLRVRFMESALSLTATSATVGLPADYMGFRAVHIEGTDRYSLEYRTPEQLNSISSDSRQPQYYTVRGEYMVFPADPSSTITVAGTYYAKPTALSASNETNWITANFPQVYLFAALKNAAIYGSDDEAIGKYSALLDKALSEIEAADDGERYGPAPVMRSETWKW